MADKPQVLEIGRRSLKESAAYRELRQKLGTASRLPMPAAALVFGELARDLGRPLLVVLSHESDAYAWMEAARLFAPASREDEAERVAYFSAPSLLPYQEADTSLAVRAEESLALLETELGAQLRPHEALFVDQDWATRTKLRPFRLPSVDWLTRLVDQTATP